jgi:hypothetical protein
MLALMPTGVEVVERAMGLMVLVLMLVAVVIERMNTMVKVRSPYLLRSRSNLAA